MFIKKMIFLKKVLPDFENKKNIEINSPFVVSNKAQVEAAPVG